MFDSVSWQGHAPDDEHPETARVNVRLELEATKAHQESVVPESDTPRKSVGGRDVQCGRSLSSRHDGNAFNDMANIRPTEARTAAT